MVDAKRKFFLAQKKRERERRERKQYMDGETTED